MIKCSIIVLYFFFFQAEDGIRDVAVTGVQTCALPILIRSTGFGICARHVESAERMASYCGTCAFAINVQIADMELTDRAFNLVTRAGIHSTSEAKFRIVRDLQRMVVVF